jgi:hypothetical protein
MVKNRQQSSNNVALADNIRQEDFQRLQESPLWKDKISGKYAVESNELKRAQNLLKKIIEIAATEAECFSLARQSPATIKKIILEISKHVSKVVNIDEVAENIWVPIRQQLLDEKEHNKKKHKDAGQFNALTLHALNQRAWMTTEHISLLLPRPISGGYYDVWAAYHQEAMQQYSEDLKKYYFNNPEIHTLSFPVGPRHWRLVTLEKEKEEKIINGKRQQVIKENGKILVEIFDSFGTGSAKQIEEMIRNLLLASGIAGFKMNFTAPTLRQADEFSCGDYAAAFAHRRAKEAISKKSLMNEDYEGYDIRLMSELPKEPQAAIRNVSIITPKGLFQLVIPKDGRKYVFKRILNTDALLDIISSQHLDEASIIAKGAHRSILDSNDVLNLDHEQLILLNQSMEQERAHPCTLYYPKIITTLESQGNTDNALRKVMRETSRIWSGDPENNVLLDEKRFSISESSDDDEEEESDDIENRSIDSDDSDPGLDKRLIAELDSLNNTIRAQPNEIKKKARAILSQITKLRHKATDDEKEQLIRITTKTYALLNASAENFEERLKNYRRLASKAQGSSHKGWKILGSLMVALGLVMIGLATTLLAAIVPPAAVAIVPTVVSIAVSAVSGGALAYVGSRFFRSAGLSKEMHELSLLKENDPPKKHP